MGQVPLLVQLRQRGPHDQPVAGREQPDLHRGQDLFRGRGVYPGPPRLLPRRPVVGRGVPGGPHRRVQSGGLPAAAPPHAQGEDAVVRGRGEGGRPSSAFLSHRNDGTEGLGALRLVKSGVIPSLLRGFERRKRNGS